MKIKILANVFVLVLMGVMFVFCAQAIGASTTWPVASYETSTQLAGWEASKLFDGDVNTQWSSERQSTATDKPQRIVFQFDTYHNTNFVKLYPRYSNGSALSFPVRFTIDYSDGSKWETFYKDFIPDDPKTPEEKEGEDFPNPKSDWIILAFPQTYNAKGITVRAEVLGTDDNGKYYFQLGEVAAGYDEGFETLQFLGLGADEGVNLIENVGADAFNPNKISNWNYDYRLPLQTSTCSAKPNIYSHQTQWVENEQRWYLYYGGQDTVSGSTCDSSHDRIYMTVAEKDFQTISQEERRAIISEGQFHHVNNPSLTRADDGVFAMAYTAAWDKNAGDAAYNRPAYATSSDGFSWNPSNAGDPYGTNSLITVDNYHSGDWNNAYINNQNGLLYDRGQYWYYWGPEGLGGSDYRGHSSDMKNFTEEGAVSFNKMHSVNDVKRFHWSGQDYYLMVSQQNEAAIYSSLTTDPSSFPQESLLFNNLEAETEANDELDDYIVSAGLVTDGTALRGVLYAASPTESKNRNKLFATWLQKKVLFTLNADGEIWGGTERSEGPNKIRLAMDANKGFIQTGRFNIYDTDGTTLLYTSPDVTIASGMKWKFNYTPPPAPALPCGFPETGDWVLSESCTVNESLSAPGNLTVQNNAVLTVGDKGAINIDFVNQYLKVKDGSGVFIKDGGKLD